MKWNEEIAEGLKVAELNPPQEIPDIILILNLIIAESRLLMMAVRCQAS